MTAASRETASRLRSGSSILEFRGGIVGAHSQVSREIVKSESMALQVNHKAEVTPPKILEKTMEKA